MASTSDENQQETTNDDKDFFVVGIGASAGGLRALEEFFENMPADSGAAFVVIQHLSPDFKSLMKELLERYTKMKVYRVEDGMALQPNCIYLIPPGINLVIKERRLYFQQQDRNRPKPNFPIDIFLQSLAEDVGDRAVGIILSGSGSDGSEGLRLLNENGGITMSQDPGTAEFDGMPTSAISTRLVDRIGSPQELAEVVYNYLKSPPDIQRINGHPTLLLDTYKLQQITTIVNRHNNINFSHYKPSTLSRRIHRRCLITECSSIDDYILRLQVDTEELEILCNDLLISVTQFFRDAKAWQFIENNIIPSLVKQTKPGGEIRCWVSACATGEEAYSLAILLDEAISDLDKQIKVKIFATDIDKIEKEDRNIVVSLKVSNHQGTKLLSGDFYRVEIKQEEQLVESDSNAHYFEADAEASRRITQLEYELQQTRENLQATIEELETTNEEQQATNEELIASNEELQSTNEELHSVNEELHTVNSQYQSKILELTELNSDVENLLRTTDIGVVFLDRELRIRKFTPAATAAINLVEADIGRPLEHLSHNMDCGNFFELLEEVIASQKPVGREVKLNKTAVNLLMRIFPYRHDNNSFDGLVLTFVDINEIKKVQQQLSQTYDALGQNEQQLRAILDNTASIIYVKDIEGRYLLVNKQYLNLFNLSESQILGKTDYDLFSQELAETLRANDRKVLEAKTALKFDESVPVEDNHFIYLSIKAPLFDSDGVAYGICGISSDITNLLQANTKLEQQSLELTNAKQNAEAANHAKSEFLARMTHELRTPLNAILGFTQILNRQRSLQAQQKQYLDTILRSGQHLLALINDILDISKIEAGMAELNITCFDLYNLLDGIESMLHIKARSKQLQLTFEINPELPQYIQTDENKLRQVLINILGNAIKFTDSGSVKLFVEVFKESSSSVHNSTLHLQFQVTDTGRGIAPQELNNIFDAFVQSNPTYQVEDGTGLGLAICQRFVQLMGGDIQIESDLGQGTTVKFDLLLGLANSVQVDRVLPKGRVTGLADNQPELNILIVEDNWDNRQLLIQILTPIGFKLIEASNGQEAVELWERHHPNLILMDMRMPVMDGYQATKIIKQKESQKTNTQSNTPIIALTATAFNEDKTLMLTIGCDDFIPKPFPEELLLEKIAVHTGANYTYEFDGNISNFEKNINLEQFIPEALQVMSQQWCRQLYNAALRCNQNAVLQLIEEIPQEYNNLQSQLNNLANNFQFDTIASFSEQVWRND